jgi:signal transduction histidine kinase
VVWRRPWWQLALGGLVIAYVAAGLVVAVISAAWTRGWLGAFVMLALHLVALGIALRALRRPGESPLLMLLAIIAGSGAEALSQYAGTGLLFVAVWLAPFRTRPLHMFLLTVLAIGGFVGASYVSDVPPSATFGIAFGLMWAAFFGAILNQLSVTRQQASALAEGKMLAERQRLAREIHDVLAHSLSAQVVHLEGTRMLMEKGCSAEQALDRVVRAGDLARAGLEETKRAVAALRGDQAPLTGELESLATEFRALTGNPCTMNVSGDPDLLVAETRLAILRTAQEALTNVHKHSPGASVTIALSRTDGWCELEVVDTGGKSRKVAGNGYGLVGMRERAELIGGNMQAGPTGDGFRVRLRVPA